MRAPTTPDYFYPFASGDRPQPAPLLPSSPSAVLLYLGAGLDLYPVASHFAGYSTFLYVDAKPRLTRAPGDRDHAAWRAPEEVARSVVERALGVLDGGWELVAPEILKFEGRGGVRLYYVFATLDFELVQQAATFPFLATLLERVEGLYVHGLYISPETGLHLPNLQTVYAIPGNASCVDVDFIQEHDCTPPGPDSPYYIPTRAEQEHYERLCVWAGVNPHTPPPMQEYGTEADQLLERFVGLSLTASPKPPKEPKPGKEKKCLWKSKTKESLAKPRGPPLRFVLIDQISWDEDLPRGTIPPPPVPSRTGLAWEVIGRPSSTIRKSNTFSTDEIKPRQQVSVELEVGHQKRESIPHILPPLPPSTSTFTPASLRGYPSNSSLRKKQSLRGFPSTQSLRGLAQLQLSTPPIRESTDDVARISRPKSGGGTSQGLVRCSSRRTGSLKKGGGYRVSKTVREAEAVWEERDRKERERRREEKRMRERGMDVLGAFITCGQPARTARSDVDDPKPHVHLAEAILYQARVTAHLLQKRHPEDPIFPTDPVNEDHPDLRVFLAREFNGIKSQLGALNTKVTALDTKFSPLDRRIGELKRDGTLQQNRVALDGVTATVQGLVNTPEFKSAIRQAVTEHMGGIQGSISSNVERLDAVQATTSTLRSNMTTLQNTIGDVRTTLTNVQAISAANAEALANLQATSAANECGSTSQPPGSRHTN